MRQRHLVRTRNAFHQSRPSSPSNYIFEAPGPSCRPGRPSLRARDGRLFDRAPAAPMTMPTRRMRTSQTDKLNKVNNFLTFDGDRNKIVVEAASRGLPLARHCHAAEARNSYRGLMVLDHIGIAPAVSHIPHHASTFGRHLCKTRGRSRCMTITQAPARHDTM